MDKVEIIAVIKYLFKKGMSPKEIHEDFIDTLGKEPLTYSTVENWASEFKRGRKSIGDDKRPVVHYFDPESEKKSMQWKHPGSPPPKKF